MLFQFCELAFHKAVSDALRLASGVGELDVEIRAAGLRGSLLLGVSAFDFIIHEIVRIECVRNVRSGMSLNMDLPAPVSGATASAIEREVDLFVRRRNSTKAFVSSKSIKAAFLPVYVDVWKNLELSMGQDAIPVCKEIDNIWRWRNRIAHEGDFIPSSLMFRNWPIIGSDVTDKIDYLRHVGDEFIKLARCRTV